MCRSIYSFIEPRTPEQGGVSFRQRVLPVRKHPEMKPPEGPLPTIGHSCPRRTVHLRA